MVQILEKNIVKESNGKYGSIKLSLPQKWKVTGVNFITNEVEVRRLGEWEIQGRKKV